MRNPFVQALLTNTLNSLCDKNKDLLNSFIDETSLNIPAITDANWEATFSPLSALEIETCLTVAKQKYPDEFPPDHVTSFEHLADRSWITLGQSVFSRYQQLWPRNMLQLCVYHRSRLPNLVTSNMQACLDGSQSVSSTAGSVAGMLDLRSLTSAISAIIPVVNFNI